MKIKTIVRSYSFCIRFKQDYFFVSLDKEYNTIKGPIQAFIATKKI